MLKTSFNLTFNISTRFHDEVLVIRASVQTSDLKFHS